MRTGAGRGARERASGTRISGARACASPERWRALGNRMLTASVTHVRRTPPLGFLGRQCCPRWERQSELVYGLFYALEAGQLGGR